MFFLFIFLNFGTIFAY